MNVAEILGGAVESMADNNLDSTTTTAVDVFFLISAGIPLNEQYDELLKKDQSKYFRDSLQIAQPGKSNYAALAAADYAKYEMDSSNMSNETSLQGQILEDEKTQVRNLGNGMAPVYNLELPIEQLNKMTTNAILGFITG